MEKSRMANSIRNILFSFSYQIITILLSFINRSVFIFTLGISYLGISGLFSDILTMLSLADLGFGVALTYSMYKPLADRDYNRLAALTNLYRKVYRIIALAVTIIGLLLVPFLKYLINLKHPIPHITLYYLMYLANTVASYLVIYKTSIITADQKDYILNKYRSYFGILQTLFMTIFLWITHNYFVYLLVQVIFTYIQNFYCSHVASKMYPFINNKIKMPLKDIKEIFKNLYSVFLYKISGVLLNATDNTIISIMIGTGMVGYYSNYSMITARLTGLINTIFYSLTASLGNLVVTEKPERRYKVFLVMQSISSIFSTTCVICLMLLTQDLIRIWLGSSYVLSTYTLCAILLNFYLGIILLPIWVYREATGLYQQTKYVMVITAIINLVLSIYLAKKMGITGVLLASAIARLLTYFWYEPVLLFKKYFDESSLVYFRHIVINIFITIIISRIEMITIGKFVPQNWGTLIFKAIITGITSLSLVLLLYARSGGFKLIMERIKTISIRKKRNLQD
ncbi:oligosaccharide flippase family protein [Weissella confusa]|uniref:Transporter n=1 Tax=Limosilactobacillus reuteri TaxID=1598 RepID=A0A2T5Q1I5_LIMRT|nr:oligosaccharide flippase family protein [Limosilactobacillus reuteri]MCW3764655.1 oligosaccharide flippase family protein [Weissella confusa]PTV01205.1 transporter [Limosilactobacillus reuteri]